MTPEEKVAAVFDQARKTKAGEQDANLVRAILAALSLPAGDQTLAEAAPVLDGALYWARTAKPEVYTKDKLKTVGLMKERLTARLGNGSSPVPAQRLTYAPQVGQQLTLTYDLRGPVTVVAEGNTELFRLDLVFTGEASGQVTEANAEGFSVKYEFGEPKALLNGEAAKLRREEPLPQVTLRLDANGAIKQIASSGSFGDLGISGAQLPIYLAALSWARLQSDSGPLSAVWQTEDKLQLNANDSTTLTAKSSFSAIQPQSVRFSSDVVISLPPAELLAQGVKIPSTGGKLQCKGFARTYALNSPQLSILDEAAGPLQVDLDANLQGVTVKIKSDLQLRLKKK